jgi:sterol desaturase/sphingolipid hydroxylase (fatty acid hydroxylase superfamily)
VDVNFAVRLLFIDALFGTFHLPGSRWIRDAPVPEGCWAQLVLPFRRPPPATRQHAGAR